MRDGPIKRLMVCTRGSSELLRRAEEFENGHASLLLEAE
jgi:hypothetical protein